VGGAGGRVLQPAKKTTTSNPHKTRDRLSAIAIIEQITFLMLESMP